LPNEFLWRNFPRIMQGKNILIIFLIILGAALGIGLIVRNNNANEEKQKDTAHITQLSNDVVQVRGQLDDQKSVNMTLEGHVSELKTNIVQIKATTEAISNKLTQTEAALGATAATLEKTQADLKQTQEEVAKREAKIKELEGQNDELTKKMVDLNTSLGNLEKQIADTERKLAASEGDRAFLLKELKRLQAEKAELERQFNDLAVLRDQVRKLKEELSIARRLEWIRRGIYGVQNAKGAEVLLRPRPTAPAGTNADLNVELKQSGGVKIQSGTNAPPPK
jgi:chromosome segregation ATPase